MLNQKPKARWRFNQIPSRFSLALRIRADKSPCDQMICRGCRQTEPGVDALGRRSAHRRPLPGTMAGFAGPARRLRSDGRQKPGSAEVACLEQVTIAPMWSRAPAQRRRALLPARRHRPPSALVGLCLTNRNPAQLSGFGTHRPFDFIFARVMPVLAGLFPAAQRHGFQNIYQSFRRGITQRCPETRRL